MSRGVADGKPVADVHVGLDANGFVVYFNVAPSNTYTRVSVAAIRRLVLAEFKDSLTALRSEACPLVQGFIPLLE
jgi:hypothetical protein